MRYRAVIKQSGTWWIGWLIDLPGVNAREKTKKELVKSLITGAQDMLATVMETALKPAIGKRILSEVEYA
jgi:hypothetical protein